MNKAIYGTGSAAIAVGAAALVIRFFNVEWPDFLDPYTTEAVRGAIVALLTGGGVYAAPPNT